MRLALGIEYDGSRFLGWQTQPGGGTDLARGVRPGEQCEGGVVPAVPWAMQDGGAERGRFVGRAQAARPGKAAAKPL